LRVLLGSGADVANLAVGPLGKTGGSPRQVFVDGGTENDRIAVVVSVMEGNSVGWDVRVLGQSGNDNLSLMVKGTPAARSFFLIDGGAGIDTYVATDFVKVSNCEKQGQ
jgi:hypothetical protein